MGLKTPDNWILTDLFPGASGSGPSAKAGLLPISEINGQAGSELGFPGILPGLDWLTDGLPGTAGLHLLGAFGSGFDLGIVDVEAVLSPSPASQAHYSPAQYSPSNSDNGARDHAADRFEDLETDSFVGGFIFGSRAADLHDSYSSRSSDQAEVYSVIVALGTPAHVTAPLDAGDGGGLAPAFDVLAIASTAASFDLHDAVSTGGSSSIVSILGAVGVGAGDLVSDHFLFDYLRPEILSGLGFSAGSSTYDDVHILTGTSDVLRAGDGDDLIVSHSTGTESTWMLGDDGNDTLVNGRGYTVMFGGAGDDVFIIDPARFGGSNLWVDIRDFEAGDKIDLGGFDVASFAELQPYMIIQEPAAPGHALKLTFQLGDDSGINVLTRTETGFVADDFVFGPTVVLPHEVPDYSATDDPVMTSFLIPGEDAGTPNPEGEDADDDVEDVDDVAGQIHVLTGIGETLRAGGGDDLIVAHSVGTESTWLYGNGGNDTLVNGHGNNVMFGGAGEDLFIIDPARFGGSNLWVDIRDFEAGDKIDLSGFDVASFAELQPYMIIEERGDALTLKLHLDADSGINVLTRTETGFVADDFVFGPTIVLPDEVPDYSVTDDPVMTSFLIPGEDDGSGNDAMYGGAGDDLFHFENGSGQDRIGNFVTGTGSPDQIDISDFGFSNLTELLAVTTDGSDTVIQLDADDSITLIGIRAADLHEDDFIFA